MLLLDQSATVTWLEMGQMQTQKPGNKLLTDSRSRDFKSVRNALRFIMETLNEASRASAMIHTDDVTLHQADIEAMYAQIKQS